MHTPPEQAEPAALTQREIKAVEIAQANQGKLARNALGQWTGGKEIVEAGVVAALVQKKRMTYTARKATGSKHATEATLV